MTSSTTVVPASVAFPYWCVGDKWNERDRHATWRDAEKVSKKPPRRPTPKREDDSD